MGLAPSGSPSHGRQPPRHGALWRAATLAAIYRANAGGRTPSPPTRSPTYGSRRVPTRRLSLFVAVHGWGAPLGGELLRHGALHDDRNIASPWSRRVRVSCTRAHCFHRRFRRDGL